MLPDGTMVSVPLEDLAPFLPEEELKRRICISRWWKISRFVSDAGLRTCCADLNKG